MLVSDCPQANEVKLRRGYSSQAARMDFQALEAAGMPTRDLFSTYVVNFRPPSGELSTLFWKRGLPVEGYRSFGGTTDKNCLILDYVYDELVRLREEIKRVQPSVILLYGRYALYFLAGETKQIETHKSSYGALLKWRASSLQLSAWWQYERVHVAIPTLPLNCTYTLPDKQFLVKPDLKRIKRQIDESKHGDLSVYTSRKVSYEILSSEGTEQDFQIVVSRLLWLLSKAELEVLPLATDVETIAYSYIDCFTLAWSSSEAICIPFECKERAHYWTTSQEEYLHTLIRALFLHPNVRHYGQNYIYDVQYYLRNLCVYVKAEHDSQVMNHTLYSIMEKRLDFLSSYYCKVYKYWKGNGKIDQKTKKRPENVERWTYNCDDGTITFEVVQALLREYTGANQKLNAAYRFQMYEVTPAVTRMMLHGIRIDTSTRDRNILLLEAEAEQLAKRFNHALMMECNLKSSQQMQSIFYDLFKCPKTYKRTIDANGIEKNTPTLDEDVLHDLWDTQPLLRGLIDILLDYKKLTKTASSLAGLTLDIDGRLRCQYGVCGTDTYRFNSKANAFGTGNNLQVLSKGDKLRNGRKLPNTKEIILPDEGCVFFDIDLSAADARIVAAISRCTELLDILDSGEDLYVLLLREYYRDQTIGKKDSRRQTFKMICHGSNYMGKAAGLAARSGLNFADVERLQKYYFGRFPEIVQWHKELEQQVMGRGWIENVFGYRRYFFDKRAATIMNVAAAYNPQSTVALLINKGMCSVMRELPEVKVQMQTHDSFAGSFPKEKLWLKEEIVKRCLIPLPYERPMTIPVNIGTSDMNWGSID
jgi:DNA polymerase-1